VALRLERVIDGDNPREIARLTAAAMNGLVAENLAQIDISASRGKPIPPLYACGVRYLTVLVPRRAWWSIWEVLEVGGGICEDFACWRIAELGKAGVEARPMVYFPEDGGRMMHALVGVLNTPENVKRWKDLTIEQCKGVDGFPGPAPAISTTVVMHKGRPFKIEDPSRTLGMPGKV